MISIQYEATFFGANPFATRPVLVASIHLSGNISAFEKILERGCRQVRSDFPEWFCAAPSLQHPVLAMTAQTAAQWALGALNEVRGFLHDAGAQATPEGARLWLGFHRA